VDVEKRGGCGMTEQKAIQVLNGTIDDINEVIIARAVAVLALQEIQQYRALGTVEELREAREKQRAKKPKINKVDKDTIYMKCSNCKLTTVLYSGMQPDFCPKCGQAIDWSKEE